MKSYYNNLGVFFTLLTIVLITLKLTGYIGWSWWLVTAYLWAIPLLAVTLFAYGGFIVMFKKRKFKQWLKKQKSKEQ